MSKSPQNPKKPKFSEHVLDLRQIADQLREDSTVQQPKPKRGARLASWMRPTKKSKDEGVFSIQEGEKEVAPKSIPEKLEVKVTRSQKRELKKEVKRAKKLEAATVEVLNPQKVMAKFATQKEVDETADLPGAPKVNEGLETVESTLKPPAKPKKKRGRPKKKDESELNEPEEEEVVEPIPQVEDILGPSENDLLDTEDVAIPSSEELMEELLDGIEISNQTTDPAPEAPPAPQPPALVAPEAPVAPSPGYDFGQPSMPQVPGAPMPGGPQSPAHPMPQPPAPGDPMPQPPQPQAPTGNAPVPNQSPITGIDPDPFIDLNGLRQEQPYFDLQETAAETPIFPKNPTEARAKLASTKKGAKVFARASGVFGFVAMVFVLPIVGLGIMKHFSYIQDQILFASHEAVDSLEAGGAQAQNMSLDGATQNFSDAHQSFLEAEQTFDDVNAILDAAVRVVPQYGDQYRSAEGLIDAGTHLTHAAKMFASVAGTLEGNPLEVQDSNSLTDVLIQLYTTMRIVRDDIAAADTAMAQVDINAVPEAQRMQVQFVKDQLPTLSAVTEETMRKIDLLSQMLGSDGSKRYLFVFQNNREMRPTGGFIGSIALMDIAKGHVEQLVVPGGGVYDVAGQTTVTLEPPAPLRLVSPNWNLQDANWWPDFPTSAKKLQWFFQKAKQPSVDGVLALNPDVIEELLRITGGIDLGEPYNVTIDESNFYEWSQEKAERKADETLVSKDFIGQMAPILLNNVFEQEPENLALTLAALMQALEEKDIMLYFNDDSLQANVEAEGWAGAIAQVEHDYLSVVHTNISGGKTDQVIDETIEHHAEIAEDGSIIDTVTLTKVHQGDPAHEFAGVRNLDYVRFYVPEGSEIISSSGFADVSPKLYIDLAEGAEIDHDLVSVSGQVLRDDSTGIATNNEFGKTVFGNWMEVQPGESSTVKISYKLPFNFFRQGDYSGFGSYGLFVQKQSGVNDPYFHSTATVPRIGSLLWANPEYLSTTPSGFEIAESLAKDKFYGFLFQY